MKRTCTLLLCVALLLCGCAKAPDPRGTILDPENTFLILAEKDNYPEGFSNLENDFLNIRQIEEAFLGLGVPEAHIRIIEDDLSRDTLEGAMQWLSTTAPEDAAVFTYVGAHGRYLNMEIGWNQFMPELWSTLAQRDKVLIVDACNAGLFTKPFEEIAASGIVYATVQANELDWWGSECENLPIVGGIWVHYFVEGLTSAEADLNADQAISFTELHTYADSRTQTYMAENIFSNEEYLAMYENAGYYPTRKDTYPNAVFIDHLEQDLILTTY